MEQYGNTTTFNFELVLRENIVSHEYMRRTARSMNTWAEVIDEVYDHVEHVEPWMTGNVRGPSTAFCLLYRLMELKLTEQQIRDTIECKDSPYIRAIGFLYLRYVGDPKQLWSWFEPFVDDREEKSLAPMLQKFWPSGEGIGKEVTMGEYTRDLLLCQFYFQTIFTRIPKKTGDFIVERLTELKLPTQSKGNGGQGGPDRRAGEEGRARPASVKASLSVSLGPRSTSRMVREDTRDIVKPDSRAAAADRDGDRDRDRGAGCPPRDRAPGRRIDDRDPRGVRDRERDRDWDRDRNLDRARDWGDRGDPRRDWRERGGDERRRGGYDSRDRDRHRDSNRHRDRDGDRDRNGERGRGDAPPASAVFGRSAADVFGKSAVPLGPPDSLKSAYGVEKTYGGSSERRLDRTEEVFRIGGRR